MFENMHHNFKDLRGKRYGDLIPYDLTPEKRKVGSFYVWQCYCLSCGGFSEVASGNLVSGHTQTCGCIKGREIIDLTGKRFGYLEVITIDGKNRFGHIKWKCHCTRCGRLLTATGGNLKSGKTKSCGCIKAQHAKDIGKEHTTHGKSVLTKGVQSIYRSWTSMWQRCSNRKSASFKHYGGRGIGVCDSWRKFENFLSDMGERPVGTSIDRINPNGNYEPGNCRWATPKMQANNRRSARNKEK